MVCCEWLICKWFMLAYERDLDLCFLWWNDALDIEYCDHVDLLDYMRLLIVDLGYSVITWCLLTSIVLGDPNFFKKASTLTLVNNTLDTWYALEMMDLL